MKIKGNQLIALGYPEERVVGMLLDLIQKEFAGTDEKEERFI